MSRNLERDPFARATLVKRNSSHTEECAWCGNKDRRGQTHEYAWEQDRLFGGYRAGKLVRFCSRSCFESYTA